jgi:hypothetical protein
LLAAVLSALRYTKRTDDDKLLFAIFIYMLQ